MAGKQATSSDLCELRLRRHQSQDEMANRKILFQAFANFSRQACCERPHELTTMVALTAYHYS